VRSQLLIFFQYLQNLPGVGDPPNARLSPKQRSTISGFATKAEALLDKIAPRGHRFLKGAQHILNRETHWIGWKDRGDGKERCPTLSVRLFLRTTAGDKTLPKVYVDVEGGNHISELKSKVADKLGIPAAEQRLTVEKQELEDGKLICDYDLPSKTIVLVQRSEPQPEMPPMRKRRQVSAMGAQKRVKLGTEELTRLWNCGSTDLAGILCASSLVHTRLQKPTTISDDCMHGCCWSTELTDSAIPSLTDYLEPAIDQAKENAAMTEEERKEVDADDLYKNDKLFVWRALRLMAKHNVKAFESLTSGEDMDNVLKEMGVLESAKGGDDQGEDAAA
jgi:hypothetical protein